MGGQEPHEVGIPPVLLLDRNKPTHQNILGATQLENSLTGKNLGSRGHQVACELMMWPCIKGSQGPPLSTGDTCSAVPCVGLLSAREMWTCWRESSEEPREWWRDWSNSPVRNGLKSWCCSAWNREGSIKTLWVYINTWWRPSKEDKTRLYLVVPGHCIRHNRH